MEKDTVEEFVPYAAVFGSGAAAILVLLKRHSIIVRFSSRSGFEVKINPPQK